MSYNNSRLKWHGCSCGSRHCPYRSYGSGYGVRPLSSGSHIARSSRSHRSLLRTSGSQTRLSLRSDLNTAIRSCSHFRHFGSHCSCPCRRRPARRHSARPASSFGVTHPSKGSAYGCFTGCCRYSGRGRSPRIQSRNLCPRPYTRTSRPSLSSPACSGRNCRSNGSKFRVGYGCAAPCSVKPKRPSFRLFAQY